MSEVEHTWTHEAGEILCSGLPPEIWDDIIVKWNREQFERGHHELQVSVLHGPLFKVIYDEGKKRGTH